MHVPKQRPGRPGPGARATTPPPQGLGNGSDAAQAIPEGAGHLGALKGTPGRLRQINMRHTSPTTPKTLPTLSRASISPALASRRPRAFPDHSSISPAVYIALRSHLRRERHRKTP